MQAHVPCRLRPCGRAVEGRLQARGREIARRAIAVAAVDDRLCEIGADRSVRLTERIRRQPQVDRAAGVRLQVLEAPSQNFSKLVDVRRLWPDVIEAVKHRKRVTWIHLTTNSQVVGFDGSTLTLGFVNAGARRSFEGGHLDIVKQAITDVIGADWQIETIEDAGADPTAGPPPEPATPRVQSGGAAVEERTGYASPAESPEALGRAFRDVHGRHLHGFALLLLCGDAPTAAAVTVEALDAGAARVGRLRHPERAAAWLRSRVLQAARAGTPEDRERAAQVQKALAQLSDTDYEILVMRFFEQLSNQETAEALGIDPGAACKRYGRALLHLRDKLASLGFFN